MKVIGKIENGRYICEVSHTEIEQFLDMYYGKMKELAVGENIDLGSGYKHYEETRMALKETQDFFKANIKNIKAITNAFLLEQSEAL